MNCEAGREMSFHSAAYVNTTVLLTNVSSTVLLTNVNTTLFTNASTTVLLTNANTTVLLTNRACHLVTVPLFGPMF
jgi:hypothetical protein